MKLIQFGLNLVFLGSIFGSNYFMSSSIRIFRIISSKVEQFVSSLMNVISTSNTNCVGTTIAFTFFF